MRLVARRTELGQNFGLPRLIGRQLTSIESDVGNKAFVMDVGVISV